MSGQWFRMYETVLDDPKVQRLPAETFRAWVNLLCLAKRHDGVLPSVEDIAFALRVSNEAAVDFVEQLASAGLLDKTETGLVPHNWNGRQYKSDVSTDRVKRFRKRSKKQADEVTGNGGETPDETPPDTETDTETDNSEPNGSAAVPPEDPLSIPLAFCARAREDPKGALFNEGLAWLTARYRQLGQPPPARSVIGKWLQLAGQDGRAVWDLLVKCSQGEGGDPVGDPVSWIQARLQPSDEPDVMAILQRV